MSDLHIQRDHHLGLPRAREVARAWARKAEEKFDMPAKLGFLFTAFKDRIEAEIGGQLDALLGTPSPTSLA